MPPLVALRQVNATGGRNLYQTRAGFVARRLKLRFHAVVAAARWASGSPALSNGGALAPYRMEKNATPFAYSVFRIMASLAGFDDFEISHVRPPFSECLCILGSRHTDHRVWRTALMSHRRRRPLGSGLEFIVQ